MGNFISVSLVGIGVIALVAFGVALVTCFNPQIATFTAIPYAILEGIVLGGVSSIYEAKFPGIVSNALFITIELMVVIVIVGIIAAVAVPLLNKKTSSPDTRIATEFTIKINEIEKYFYIGYRGMNSPSSFVLSHCPTNNDPHLCYYPTGIDTIFDGRHAFTVKEVAPKYIILKALY